MLIYILTYIYITNIHSCIIIYYIEESLRLPTPLLIPTTFRISATIRDIKKCYIYKLYVM